LKSSDVDIDLSNKGGFLEQLELPYFIGIVDRKKLSLKIYSGRALHLLFSMKGIPNRMVIKFTPQIQDKTYYEIVDEEQKHYNLMFPFLAEVSANRIDEDSQKIFPILASECSLIHQNISSRRMGEYILGFGLDDFRIFAGPGSVQQFRRNFCLRMAEVFYNLDWILRNSPQAFSKPEFSAYASSWTLIRQCCAPEEQALVDNIYNPLAAAVSAMGSLSK
jgi:hypothetical protein